jgi:branched-chain amino acid transport system substrate-binding protein
MTVYTAVEGLPALEQGEAVKYSGASGPCRFTAIGDISDCKFRYNRVENGAFRFLEVS